MHAGAVVAHRYVIERRAGAGAMGVVYRALDLDRDAPVALKVLRGAEPAQRFAREIAALAQLSHPGIVRYVDHGRTEDGQPFLVMEWLEGETLAQYLSAREPAILEAVVLAHRVAEALAAAHRRGMVHRDVKPSNLFLVGGRPEAAKVVDFGVVRVVSAHQLTLEGALVGTPGYMAPEQAKGQLEVDARADVFALGCVLYRCLTGRAPFASTDMVSMLARTVLEAAPPPSELRPELPPILDDLVGRMLAKSVEDRPRDGAELAGELAAFADVIAEELAAPSARPIAIGQTEQRVMSIVLASRPSVSDVGRRSESTAAALAAEAHRHGGRVAVLVNDALAATFAAAPTGTDQALCAARAALAMRAACPERSVALATGRGHLSAGTVTGEVIERAARLLQAPPPARGVRVDESTVGLLDARFRVEGDETGLLVTAERELIESRRTLLGKATPCVGRDVELSLLLRTFDECARESVARAALVVGPAGIGKSRLRYEFLRGLKGASPRVEIWLGRGDALATRSPFGLIAPALRRSAGIRDDEPVAVRAAKLRARVGRNLGRHAAWPVPEAPDVDRLCEFLGELAAIPHPGEASAELRSARQDPVIMGDRIRLAWEDFLAAECAAGPVLLVLEDLHWGDRPSLRLVKAALSTLRHAPLMVLGLARPDADGLATDLWTGPGVDEIRLGTLGQRASEALVTAALGSDADPQAVAGIARRAAGNPFYLEELIRAVGEGRAGDAPDTVVAAVQGRLETLDVEGRRVLRAASIFGAGFWAGAVSAVLTGSLRPDAVDAWLTTLADRELVQRRPESKFSGEVEYVFRHDLVREAAYTMLTDADRARGHQLAGAWLSLRGETDASVLAEHFERGGEATRAVGWYLRAAEQALEANDFTTVIDRARRGIACGATGDAQVGLHLCEMEAHRWLGNNVELKALGLATFPTLPRGSDRWYHVGSLIIISGVKIGTSASVHHVVQDLAAEFAATSPTGAAVAALARAAVSLATRGEGAAARSLLELIDRRAAGVVATDAYARTRVLDARAALLSMAGDIGGGLALRVAAIESAGQAGDLRGRVTQISNLGSAYLSLGMYEEASERLRSALAEAQRMSLRFVVTASEPNLALALARVGRRDDALAIVGRGVEGSREQGDRRFEGASRIYRALILLEAGEAAAAEQEALAAGELLRDVPPMLPYALAVAARARLALGRIGEATAPAREAFELLEGRGEVEEGESLVRLTWAEALHAAGWHDEACAVLAVARARILEGAARLGDPEHHRSFLERVPENARTLELARVWLPEARAGLDS